MSVAENLKAKRKARGMTQKQLAEASKVSQQAISFIESKRNTPSEGTMRLLAAALDCTVAELLGEEAKPVRPGKADEARLLALYRRMNDEGRARLIEQAEDMVALPKYTQESAESVG